MIPWTVAHQGPLSMGFSRQKCWGGLPCPPLGDLLDPRIKSVSSALAGRFLTLIFVYSFLQTAVKRREVKSKGEKERYTHLNAEFQRIARRDKKTFLSNQCKEIEENNRMGKTRDLFKKIRYTKGTYHAKMGSIKDRNGMDLTEAEDIKKRWQEYT